MSAKKNTIFNYFKRTSGGSPSPNAKPAKSITSTNPFSSGDAKSDIKKRPRQASPKKTDEWGDEDLDPEAVEDLCKSFEGPTENKSAPVERTRSGRSARKRIKVMADSSDDDIDKDDDVGDPDFDGKQKEESSEDEEVEADVEMEEDEAEDIGAIKNKLKEKFNNKLKRSPPSKRTPAKTPVRRFVVEDKENATPSKSALKSKLDQFASPAAKGAEDGGVNAVDVLTFPHLKYGFLSDEGIRDQNMRKPDHPDYDKSTLHVPQGFYQSQTPAHYQWWKLKSDHFDTVLFFKMGKFYELFHMDAVLAVERCGLTYMRSKEYAHCGFPEVGYRKYAEMMVDMGYKVARIEQTETPAMVESRCKKLGKATKYDKVVKREICQITTCGTRVGVINGNDASYLVAVSGDQIDGQKFSIGICFVDTSVGQVNLSNFIDDGNLTKLETMLAVYPPSEVLQDPRKLPLPVAKVLGKFVGSAASCVRFPDPKKALKNLVKILGESDDYPEELKRHVDEGDMLGLTPKASSECVISSLGAVVDYLERSLIADFVLTMRKMANVDPIDVDRKAEEYPRGSHMILDNKTIRNLDLVTTDGKKDSMFSVLNKTQTPMGKRLFTQWVCSPLLRVEDILERQLAIKTLFEDRTLLEDLKTGLKGVPDLERLVAAIHAAGVKLRDDHPESRAIYHEQTMYNSKKISRLVTCLDTFSVLNKAIKKVKKMVMNSESKILKTCIVEFPEIDGILRFFGDAFDRKDALEKGKIIPKPGVDEDYDSAKEMRKELNDEVSSYLRQQKKKLGSDTKYFGSGANAFQLEIPESQERKLDDSYTLSSQRKGFKRYMTDETKDFLKRQAEVEEAETSSLQEVSRNMFQKFSSHRKIWDKVIGCVAAIDSLISLFEYSFLELDEAESCFPEFSASKEPHLKVVQGRHPIVVAVNPDVSFIPNDFDLDENLAILTGANMGGKSTLMRQTALLVTLAQIGCKVPAQAMQLTPVDRIFTRIGATDNMFDRESTFFVELAETSIILKHANRHSLVLIDELGRGTTTFDGCAIAHAVSKFLIKKRCRTMFSTHYHELTQDFVDLDGVKVYHMAVLEEEEEKSVIFLYTVSEGPCSKSHGFNAAKLAGLQENIIQVGQKVAEDFEREQRNLMELSKIINQNCG